MGREHRARVELRWRDIDRLGHLNQAVYHDLLAEARIELLTDLARLSGIDEAFVAWVVVRVELDHHSEVRRDHGAVEIVASVDRVGASSLRIHYDIMLPDGRIAASGSTVLVAWDAVQRRKRPISDAERAALTQPASRPVGD